MMDWANWLTEESFLRGAADYLCKIVNECFNPLREKLDQLHSALHAQGLAEAIQVDEANVDRENAEYLVSDLWVRIQRRLGRPDGPAPSAHGEPIHPPPTPESRNA
jgi:NAD-dependent oxidoreductase involved in siderophore biosynthesis